MGKGADSPLSPAPPQLRLQAETKLAQAPPGKPPPRSAEELLHELRVHQIELEMQNETLRQSQIALEESRDGYVDLYDLAPIGYLTLTSEGLISKINLTGAALLQIPREKLLQKRFTSFVTADDQDRWHRHFLSVRRGQGQGAAELALRRGDGTVFHAQIDCACRRTDERESGAAAPEIRMAVTDITRRKAAEEELAVARDAADRASRAKSTFLANMSHEMRTPLHVIIGLAHLLRRDLADATQRERVDQLCGTSDHLLAVINDVLDLSKIEARRFVLDQGGFRLGAVVTQVCQMAEARAREKKLRLTVDVPQRLREMALNGDAVRLAQVLINLCGNAIKFTDRGEVCLRIDCPAEDGAGVTLRFAVSDTGIGIPPAELARLFRAFEQIDGSIARGQEGTGLGLAISQHLVSLMGGKIQVDSQPGRGSTFSFALVLPRATEHVPHVTAADTDEASFDGRRVLLAEDHPLGQDILFEMLEDMGCLVDVASDGTEAVACAQEHSYDLILMDMQMPRMDGLSATRAIRRISGHRNTPIVALTANAFVEDRQRCLDAGMNGHIGKPVTPATLAAVLAQWLPDLAVSHSEAPLCENDLSLALAKIPGLTVGTSWRRSAEGVADYRAQLERFIKMHGIAVKRLRESVAAGEYDAAQMLAHDLKGIAGLMGAERIASLAGELEEALRWRADDAHLAALTASCDAELARLAEAVLRAVPTADVIK
jgi:PAS domain S-box-containing protein